MENHYYKLLKIAWRYAIGMRKKLAGMYLMFVCANIFAMTRPIVFAFALNRIQEGGDHLFRDVMIYFAIYEVLDLIFWFFHGPARVMERTMAFHITANFNDAMFAKVASLPLSWHKDHHSGNIISRIKKAQTALFDFTNHSYEVVETIVKFFFSLGAICYYMPDYGWLSILFGSIVIVVIFKFDAFLVKCLNTINEKTHNYESTLYDYIANIRTVITLRLERLAALAVKSKLSEIFPTWRKSVLMNEVKWFSMNVGLALMAFTIISLYIYERTSTGSLIMVGTLTALYQYTDRFVDTFYRLGWQYEQLVWRNTDLKAVSIIESAYSKFVGERVSTKGFPDSWKTIHVKNLSYTYNDGEKGRRGIHDGDVIMKRGKKIALVGESGGGKSTMMMLLRGLQKPDSCTVVVDGENNATLADVGAHATLIPQDPEVFENTIEYNISAGLPHKKGAIEKACEIARFSSVVARLPKGVKTNIKEKGVNLSGGEKQRLALARGVFVASDSSIILLDEPTSSVDAKNEALIYNQLFAHFKEACVVASIHRLTLLHLFDEVIVFDSGRIVERGDLETLLAGKGRLYELWHAHKKAS